VVVLAKPIVAVNSLCCDYHSLAAAAAAVVAAVAAVAGMQELVDFVVAHHRIR
jgi:hypothetical protein